MGFAGHGVLIKDSNVWVDHPPKHICKDMKINKKCQIVFKRKSNSSMVKSLTKYLTMENQ
jgi:hypothetical protein